MDDDMSIIIDIANGEERKFNKRITLIEGMSNLSMSNETDPSRKLLRKNSFDFKSKDLDSPLEKAEYKQAL